MAKVLSWLGLSTTAIGGVFWLSSMNFTTTQNKDDIHEIKDVLKEISKDIIKIKLHLHITE